ncbi:fatty acid desaturase [Paenibacillus shirakamiensis]|uniref:Fatty acid desaturase n=1 Tax=Paenibacillus shirakamiensis TaxID=1265935 RepID=A0ABS4JGD3_9BACL|nr:guanitoxin biosynthesis L-arginine gamma (S) hydroxylase [Paenibacillus shirakamiensis]MBP2000762.1 fatty acid desaturase [Paenibacillus shirakamiensis]
MASYEFYAFSNEIKQQLKPLSKSNNYRAFVGIMYDYFIIFVAIVLSQYNLYFYIISLVVIGSRQRALATILHDASHLCLAKNRKLNYVLGTLFSGYLIGQEFNLYKDSHVKGHHTHLGDPQKDPDYQFHIEAGLYKLKSERHFLNKYVLRPLFLLNIFSYAYYVFRYRMMQFRTYPRQYMHMLLLWIGIIGILAYMGCIKELFMYWIVPYFTTFMVIGWFIELAEHYPLVLDTKKSIKMTRNRFSHWLEAFFLSIHAENYHLTHHLQSSIPYWNIAKAHQIMLKDNTYAELNSLMGGVFISSNSNRPLIIDLLTTSKLPILTSQKEME